MTHRPEKPGRPKAILIAGPTASGKSAAALALAERVGGTIINADSMQVYREPHILTAHPSPEALSRAPHRRRRGAHWLTAGSRDDTVRLP